MQNSRIENSNNEEWMLKSMGPFKQKVSGNLICNIPTIPQFTWQKTTSIGKIEIHAPPSECGVNLMSGALSPNEMHALEELMSKHSRALDILSRH